MSSITLTNDQQSAIDHINHWYQFSDEQTFFLSGYAGTGKTSIIQPLIRQLSIREMDVQCACYTGKAALVMQSKLTAMLTVTTIHRMIYKAKTQPDGKVYFKRRPTHELRGIRLIIIDEASMISRKLYDDLLSYGIKILFIGDIGQLPPVVTERTMKYQVVFQNPDYMLTEIHRQAKDNPIVSLSFMARNKIAIPYGTHGDNGEITVIPRERFENDPVYKEWVYRFADQIICGYNNTRRTINRELRDLLGHSVHGDLPTKGDRIICLKNNWDLNVGHNPLVNGLIATVHKTGRVRDKTVELTISPYDEPNLTPTTLNVARSVFEPSMKQENPFQARYDFFDYGYAITCHKAQGSEWDNVLLLNEVLDQETHHQWLYTGITRIRKRGIIVA